MTKKEDVFDIQKYFYVSDMLEKLEKIHYLLGLDLEAKFPELLDAIILKLEKDKLNKV